MEDRLLKVAKDILYEHTGIDYIGEMERRLILAIYRAMKEEEGIHMSQKLRDEWIKHLREDPSGLSVDVALPRRGRLELSSVFPANFLAAVLVTLLEADVDVKDTDKFKGKLKIDD